MKTMLWKEWRESVRWLPLSLLLIAMLLWPTLPSRGVHSVGFGFAASTFVSIGAAVTALALGFLQTLPEQRPDFRGLLLGQPLSRRTIFFAKTLVAFVIHAISLAVPLAVAAIWILIVAPETRPAEPFELLPCVIVGMACFAFHPAACWAVCRPASWLGTRAFPLAAAAGVWFVAWLAPQSQRWSPLLIAIGFVMAIVAALYFVARNAFVTISNQPSIREPRSRHPIARSLMVTICVIGVTVAGTVTFETLHSAFRDPTAESLELRVDDDGTVYTAVVSEPQIVSTRYATYGGRRSETVWAAPAPRIPLDQPLPPMERPGRAPNELELKALTPVRPLTDRSPLMAVFAHGPGVDDVRAVYHRDGYYLLYDTRRRRLLHRIRRPSAGDTSGRFDSPEAVVLFKNPADGGYQIEVGHGTKAESVNLLVVDRNGVYAVDWERGTASPLLERPIDSFHISNRGDDHGPTLWIAHQGELRLYRVLPSETDASSDRAGSTDEPTRSGRVPVELQQARTYRLPEQLAPGDSSSGSYGVRQLDDGDLVVVSTGTWGRAVVARFDASAELEESYAIGRFRPTENVSWDTLNAFALPPVVSAIGGGCLLIDELVWGGRIREHAYRIVSGRVYAAMAMLAALHAVLGGALGLIACRRRGLASRSTWVWAVVGVSVGVGAAVAVIAIYPKLAWQRCHRCGADMRVDQESCPACGAVRERPPRQGIEILESDPMPTAPSAAPA